MTQRKRKAPSAQVSKCWDVIRSGEIVGGVIADTYYEASDLARMDFGVISRVRETPCLTTADLPEPEDFDNETAQD